MMKQFFLMASLLMAMATNVCAQITITDKDMPSVGDTIRYSNASPLLSRIDVSKTGADYNWDFSSLKSTSTDIYQYESALRTPYVFSFFGAIGLKIQDTLGLGQLSTTKVYGFYKNSTSSFTQKGYGFTIQLPGTKIPMPLKGEYTDEDEIYEFPLKHDHSSKNTFNLKIPIGTFPFVLGNFYRQGTRTTQVDGWGTITTPYAKNVKCLRVKSIYSSKDSIAITTPALNLGIPTVTVEYKWLSNTEKIPLLEVIGTETGRIFTPTSVRFRDQYSKNTHVEERTNSDFMIYPNPSNGAFNLILPINKATMARVLNSQGQVVLTQECQMGLNKLALDAFSAGVYYIEIQGNHQKITITK